MENPEKVDFIELFQKRTKRFVVDNIKLFRKVQQSEEGRVIGRQLLRSSSSVGSNYRAACRARSQAEFHSKISIVVEEADESVFWMEIMLEAEIIAQSELLPLMTEANEILKVVAKARKTSSQNK
jgi:four helix bundle protein